MMSRSSWIILVVLTGWSSRPVSAAPPELRFNRDIRPILSENCFHCHGPDATARKADLRLDVEEDAKEWAIVEGDAASSEVIARVLTEDRDLLMPPPDSERRLTDAEKQTLRRWVEQGASYQRHWSFEPPRQPTPPAVESDRVHNPIDQFVLAQLDEAGFQWAAPADRATLMRRMTLDLTGLPPTTEALDEFLADQSPDAIERLIDRLLADPRFGERMAADWLDIARYSDTYGYQVDRDRFVWPYRDWVIDAFNRNLGYNQFVIEQLAGDLLPDATRDQILATTFNRLHPQKVEGGSVPEEFRVEYVADRTQTVGTAFLGLTLECCRCHSHKYDPISQSEYYELAAFFANIDEAGLYSYFTSSVPTPTLTLPSPVEETQLQQADHQVRLAEQALEHHLRSSATGAETQAATADGAGDLVFASPIEVADFDDDSVSLGGNQNVPGVRGKAVRLTGDDAVNLKQGNFSRYQPFSVSLWMKTPDRKQRAVVFHRSRAWTDAASRGYQLLIEEGHLSWSLIHFWPGNAVRVRTADPLPIDQWVHVTVTNDGSSAAAGLSIAIDGRQVATEVVRDRLTKNITGGGGDSLAIGQRFRDRGFTNGQVDSLRIFDCELTDLEIERLAQPDETLTWISAPTDSWTDAQRARVARHRRLRQNPQTQDLIGALQAARKKLCGIQDGLQEIMVMRESPGIRKTHRLERGAYDAPAEEVAPGTPDAILSFGEQTRSDRLGLAEWMTRADHPLTSRVAVNRLWQLCFGVGLVRTPEDFGSQGQPPTHPELLDWLAVDFVNHQWDVKRALKQILMSATYQLSSRHPDSELWKKDPENRLLARHSSYRLPAEMLRDQALFLSGNLVSVVGGQPVRPYEVEASFKPSKRDSGSGLYRRSLYTYWKRTGPAPAMMTLDASKRDVCRVRRERTSSPLQAFVLLNGPQFVEAARCMAVDVMRSNPADVSEQLADVFRKLTGRFPDDGERQVIQQLYDEQRGYFAADPQRATEFLRVGEMPVPGGMEPGELAAMSMVISTLLNFDESVMIR